MPNETDRSSKYITNFKYSMTFLGRQAFFVLHLPGCGDGWGGVFFFIVIWFIDIGHLSYGQWSSCAIGPKEALLTCCLIPQTKWQLPHENSGSPFLSSITFQDNLCHSVSVHCEFLFFIFRYSWLLYIRNISHDAKLVFWMDKYSYHLVKLNGRESEKQNKQTKNTSKQHQLDTCD